MDTIIAELPTLWSAPLVLVPSRDIAAESSWDYDRASSYSGGGGSGDRFTGGAKGGSYPNLKPPRTPLEHTGATCSPLMSSRPELSGDEKRYPTAKY